MTNKYPHYLFVPLRFFYMRSDHRQNFILIFVHAFESIALLVKQIYQVRQDFVCLRRRRSLRRWRRNVLQLRERWRQHRCIQGGCSKNTVVVLRIASLPSRFTSSRIGTVRLWRIWIIERGALEVLLRVTTMGSNVGTVTFNRCSGGTCNPKKVTAEMRVTENGYAGGSLDRANDPILLSPNDLSDENG
jgi:hypothetical protein